MLKIDGLVVRYGNTTALNGVSIAVDDGEAVALLGANGAGKTSLAKALSGVVRPSSGVAEFNGADLCGLGPRKIVKMGVLQVPEGRGIVRDLTVKENLQLGLAIAGLSMRSGRSQLDSVMGAFPALPPRWGQRASTLSGGEQQMLVLARALLAEPKLLILDEPSLGLAPQIVQAVFGVVRSFLGRGGSVLLIEQNVHLALDVASRGYVLATGTVELSGTAEELRTDPRISDAYLGGGGEP